MPTPYIDANFKQKFNQDVHIEYGQNGSLFRGCMRTDGDVDGNQVHFTVLGNLLMGDKPRYGDVPITNPSHDRVTATMIDKYCAVLLEVLDVRKLSTDMRSHYIRVLNRAATDYTDDLLIDTMDTGATGSIGDYGSSDTDYIDVNMSLEIGEYFDRRDVPRDGGRYCAVTPRQWAALMKIQQFSDGDYVGADLPFKKMGHKMRTWNDMNWFMSNRLNGVGTATARCLAWHRDAIGHGINQDMNITWDWENLKQGHSGVLKLSMGATVIDTDGVCEIRLDDTGALPS